MNKKLLLLPAMFLFLLSLVFAAPVTQSSLCTQETANVATDNTLLNATAVTFFTAGTDTSFSGGLAGLNNITLVAEIRLINKCENFTIIDGVTNYLEWKNIITGNFTLYNTTNGDLVVSDGNYTLNEVTGIFDLVSGDTGYNNTLVQACYNKTFPIAYDLLKNTTRFTMPSTADYGDDIAITLLSADLNDTLWAVNGVVYTRTCSVRDSCSTAQLAIFAGFGLLALAAIVLAAFFIISIFSDGNLVVASGTAVVVGIIGLGIIIIIGYYIIASVGQSVCLI